MTLPPLPDLHPGAGYRAGEVREMLQAYGRQCAKDALLRVLALIPGGPTMDPLRLKNEILEMLQ